MEKEKIFCKLCNCQTNLTIDLFSRYHLKKYHNINLKEYYDKCIKKEDEGKCISCKKETPFLGYYKGYQTYCCLKHSQKSQIVRDKISKSFNSRDKKLENNKRKLTNLKRYNVENVSQTNEIKDQKSKSVEKRYGVIHNFLIESCKKARWKVLNQNKEEINEKRKDFWRRLNDEELNVINDNRKYTNVKKYGKEYVAQVKEFKDKGRKTHENNGSWLVGIKKTEYQKYRHLVRLETNKHISRLLRLNDGYDYYTSEKLVTNKEYQLIKPNLHYGTNPLQPTIDHKISIYYGFINNIDPKEIGSFKNLCVCSRIINSMKNRLTEKEYREKLNGNKKN